MTLVIDATPVVAMADRSDAHARVVERILRTHPGPLILPAPVTAEIDYLLGERHGSIPRRSFLADLASGQYTAACPDRMDFGRILEVDLRYADLELGLADASIIVLADRYHTNEILTFDHRHFRAVRPLAGFDSFRLLPADL